MKQSDFALLKMLDMQAAWVGMKPPGPVQIDEGIGDGRVLEIGEIRSNVIHTPGHTEGSICLYFPDQKKLIAGDTLFAGSIGRTDLPGGSLEKIMSSLRARVLVLPDHTLVIPGHGGPTTHGGQRETHPVFPK